MKETNPSESITSLKNLILQLQLTLELSQLQEIQSVYRDLLFFLAKYSFLFKAENHYERSLLSSEYASRALTWDVRGNITSIEKGRADSPYANTYSYDVRNRLVSETSGAKVRKGSRILTNASYRYAANDVSGKADGAFSSETVRLDYNASSVIIDLGSDMEVNQVNIYGRNSRISPEYLELWTKKAGAESWDKAEDESLNWKQTAEGWTVYFVSGITAKKVKLHSTWDERDADYSAVDRSTFSALAGNIFEVSFAAEGKESFWTYDAKGNRLSETERTGGIYSPVQRVTYYPNTDLIKQYGEWYFNYDRNGSLIARGKAAAEETSQEESFAGWNFDASDGEVWYYEYDMSGRMTKSSSSKKGTSGLTERAAYAYDWRGLLVKKTYAEFTADEGVSINGGSTASVTEWYEYNQNGQLLYTEKQSGSGVEKTDYIWAETTLWCEVDDGNVYWHHTDHLGTTEAVTDEAGRVVWSAEYEAFGSVLNENGTESFTPSFTGKMLDECSGLYYFNARWYDSEMGRFITVDPIRDGENWFAYVNNDPVNFVDLWGLSGSDADMAGVPSQYRKALQRQKEYNKLSDNTKNHLNNLDKDIRDAAADMMINLDKAGVDVEISFSYRSTEEQNELYNKGRDENGNVIDQSKVVTNAKGGQSYHNFGLAFDVEVYDKDGNKNWNEKSSDWQKVITEGKKQGFDAGAEWEDFKDLPHFENTKGKSLKQLREENKK